MSGSLQGKVALITGASSGIGEATARELAAQGAQVAVSARRRDRLDALAARIMKDGGDALAIAADFADAAQAHAAVAQAQQHFGRLDILVNNAGVMYLEPIDSADLGRWKHMLELNVLGLIAATQAALPGMRNRRNGHIVNVASTAGRIAAAGSGGYAASKFGVVGFSESLRKEVFQDNIRVTVIEPGVVETELREHIAHPDTQRKLNALADSMRQLQSEDVARAITFCVIQPDHVNINEILMRPTDQER